MKTEQSIISNSLEWKLLNNELRDTAQLVFLFGNKDLLKEQSVFEMVKLQYPNAEIVGCSTSGEIFQEEVFNVSVVVTAVHFDNTTIKVVSEEITSMEDSFAIGEKLIQKLDKIELAHVLILSEGLNINGSELAKGLNSDIELHVPITGGLAGDQAYFTETVIVHNMPGRKNLVLAIGFYGHHLQIGYGSLGGWDSFGVDRLVTKSKANVLLELDGQPALALYKKYLGVHAAALPASALLFPLSIMSNEEKTPIVRTVLSVDESNGSMVFAGDIPEGCQVRLMKSNFDKLIDGACGAAEMAMTGLQKKQPDLAILISCVGRKLVMKKRVEEELENVREVIGSSCTMAGFYSYGEICPIGPSECYCELHNQTMTITLFKEN